MNGLKKIIQPNTLQGKIILFSMMIVMVMSITGGFLFYNVSRFLNDYNYMVENILNTHQLVNIINNNSEVLQRYKGTGSRNYIAQLNYNKEMMNYIILVLGNDIKDKRFDDELGVLKDLAENYYDAINKLIFSEGGNNGASIAEAEELLSRISTHMSGFYKYLTDELHTTYRQFNINRMNIQIVSMIVFLIIIILNLVSIFLFTNKLMKPVKVLTMAASEISRGHFNIPSLDVGNETEEFNILTCAFRKMAESIEHYVADLNEKVNVERRLKEEEIKNERNRVLLKEAELFALQSQMNPHFIFNTLNIIVKVAYTEDADKTAALIGSMSKMLRYSLGSIKKATTLEKELASLEEYMFIQKTRFGDRLEYIKDIECDISGAVVPSLTLQPIIENAILHGIGDKEEGGYVRIHCYQENDGTVVDIEDNGVGIPGDLLDKILLKSETPQHKGHITGLGINNVKERLELLYDRRDVFSIFSEQNKGTRVRIRIPSGVDKLCTDC